MTDTDPHTERVAAVPSGVGGAVGVTGRRWYVAIVNNNSEKLVGERLARLGHESYVAVQQVMRVWRNGRKARTDRVVFPALVFVRCTEAERLKIVRLPYINRFMTDRAAGTSGTLPRPVAVIPQGQIDTLRFMLGQSDIPVTIVDTPYRVSDRVTVVRGGLRGLEGEVVQTLDGKSEVVVRIDILGSARVLIDTVDLEPSR